MVFGNPYMMYCLWILPVLGWLLIRSHRKRQAAARQFVATPMVGRLMPSLGGNRPWIKGTLLLLGIGCLMFAAARPRFGVYFEKVSQRGVDLFVLLDVSRSMTAKDIAPNSSMTDEDTANRLDRAKLDIRDLLGKLPGDRVGLIAFAGRPSMKVPLTTDQGFFLDVLKDIDTRSAPRGGSLIGDAIRKGIEAMPKRADRDQVMLLITDGEDHDSFPKEAAKQAAERGIKIFTVGMGDAKEGARVPVRDESGKLQFLKDKDENIVWSKMDQTLLRNIALDTGGAYVAAGTQAYDLGKVYEDNLAELARGEGFTEQRKRYRERFQLFLCLGMVLLMTNMLVPDYPRKNNLPREIDK